MNLIQKILKIMTKLNILCMEKKHTTEARKAISKPGNLNPMFGKNHDEVTREKISSALSKTPLGLFDLENQLIKIYNNQVEIASDFGVHKATVSRRIHSGAVFLDRFYIRKLQ